ncbi:MAG: hypothetical protein LBQ54_01585 [Planctomycetaceae bacterium]|nr:hypothetical protein [Planctomycetaceae bacterium]
MPPAANARALDPCRELRMELPLRKPRTRSRCSLESTGGITKKSGGKDDPTEAGGIPR